MVVLGINAHKRTHTVVAVDETGRKLGERTLGATTADHLGFVCDHLSGPRLGLLSSRISAPPG
ncbi:MAG: transposase [Pseudonocardiales bacterium]|nr:transposase [Pseudonocardiales bacterium]